MSHIFLLQLRKVRAVFHGMDRDEFVSVLQDYYDEAYIKDKFPEFQRDPVSFCLTRNPPGPGYRLINYALDKDVEEVYPP